MRFLRFLIKLGIVFCLIEVVMGLYMSIVEQLPEMVLSTLVFLVFAWLLHKALKKVSQKDESTPTNNVSVGGLFKITSTLEDDIELTPQQQKDLEQAKIYEKMSTNPKFHRTEQEDEASFKFESTWGKIIHPMEDAFENAYRSAYQEPTPELQIAKYKEALELFNEAKEFCYKKSTGGQIYFQDMWENLHNSQDSYFSYEDMIQQALNNVSDEYYHKIPAILKVISNQNGELLQKDIYKLLPEISRNEVQRLIRQLEKDGKILREKSGSTYKLRIM